MIPQSENSKSDKKTLFNSKNRVKFIPCLISLTILIAVNLNFSPLFGQRASGTLHVCKENPRYFADNSGKAIYLTGSHTWANFATDQGVNDPPAVFNYNGYLDFLINHNHNFFRGWVWELAYSEQGPNGGPCYWNPFPWLRTGPGKATDDKPKFNLDKFNQSWFDRLRSRVKAAGDAGIYVSIMLFQGYAIQFDRNEKDGYPLDGRNNINGIDAGTGYASNTLENPDVTAKQEEYVRKVIDTVNDLDNVLYEISNESGSYATKWQYHMIDFIHKYESGKLKQHPVGMTFEYKGGSLEDLYSSSADWISPGSDSGYGYPTDPPAADGRKVIVADTDHSYYWIGLKKDGLKAQQAWVWKNFLRGNQTLFMDPYLAKIKERNNPTGESSDPYFGIKPDPYWETIRMAMGRTRLYAQQMNLNKCIPQNNLSSTKYCLADPGKEYLVYQPDSLKIFTVELKSGKYNYEWFNPTSGIVAKMGKLKVGNGLHTFNAPFNGDAVIYLKRM